MTDRLPPNLLKLFAPRPPIPHLPPLDRAEADRQGPTLSGIAKYLDYVGKHDQDYAATETFEQTRARKKKEREEKAALATKQGLENWNPTEDPNATSDPFKTLFIGRLKYDITESDLKREFEYYGSIKNIRLVQDKIKGKSRGYAFIEFEREKDLKAAYHEADATRMKGKRIVVDVERGRSVKDWKPRRLGGGLGFTRKGAEVDNQHHSGREALRSRGEEAPRNREVSRGDNHRDSRDRRRRSRSPVPQRGRERENERFRDRDHPRYNDRDRDQRPRDYDRPRDHYRR